MERADPQLLAVSGEPRPRALVVDDDPVGRISLRKLLARCGYDSALAANGEEALTQFQAERPDIVFMDMVMPVMDGIAATLRLKQLCGDTFVPVIFVTGNSEEDDVARCIEAGGDDFIVKPYSHTVLAAKIRAMERIRDLHNRTRLLHGRMQAEQAIAKRILEYAVMGPNVLPKAMRPHLAPAATFNGDILLSAYAPSGDLHVLLGDFTGHGLAATIGALPAAETFRAMTAKGFPPAAILGEINRKLRTLLPTGMFLAAVFVLVERSLERATVTNCGMPDALLIVGNAVEASVSSAALPLAVCDDTDYAEATRILRLPERSRLILLSDGAIEVSDASGTLIGLDRLRSVLAAGAEKGNAIGAAVSAIEAHRNGMAPADDISLVDLGLGSELFESVPCVGSQHPLAPEEASSGGWRLSLELRGHALRDMNPVPLLLSALGEFQGIAPHRGRLFTVLAELYNNALDHGVLGLDSDLKRTDFATYLHERDARLQSPGDGSVSLDIDCGSAMGERTLDIRVADSGPGFALADVPPPRDDAPHGRGIHLVRTLCRSLDYDGNGNRARAAYELTPKKEDGSCES